MLDKKENIKVEGHKGTWYVIDEIESDNKIYYLLEHEIYGEDVPCVAIDQDGKLILEDIFNGIDDIIDYLKENDL